MKKSILSLVFISLLGLMSYAQGNLQFSQVKIVTNVQETVPVGKVWKVVNILPSASLVVQNMETRNFSIKVNNAVIFVAGAVSQRERTGSQYGLASSNFAILAFQPIWLPGGSTLAADQNIFMVSVIEFNVIP